MTPALATRGDAIVYSTRRSRRARRLRIVVTPKSIEIVAPYRTLQPMIDAFVHANRNWICRKVEEIQRRFASGELHPPPERYVTGTRILFRGRRLLLTVEPADVATGELVYASAFHVRVPHRLSAASRERETRACLEEWFTRRIQIDARDLVARHSRRLGATPSGIRIGNQKTLWGSCSARGVISLNRKLVAAPKRVLEYVVVHEIAHLRERNHGPDFWRLVEFLLPDYRERRAWLTRHRMAIA
jgi:predicted metal-dependent hydrolase